MSMKIIIILTMAWTALLTAVHGYNLQQVFVAFVVLYRHIYQIIF